MIILLFEIFSNAGGNGDDDNDDGRHNTRLRRGSGTASARVGEAGDILGEGER